MIRVRYSEPELKDIIEGIIQKNFFIFCNEIISQVLQKLNLPARLMNQITVALVPHTGSKMGLAYKTLHLFKLEIQDTLEENEKTLIHEAIHILKPSWDEDDVESTTNKIYNNHPKGILI